MQMGWQKQKDLTGSESACREKQSIQNENFRQLREFVNECRFLGLNLWKLLLTVALRQLA